MLKKAAPGIILLVLLAAGAVALLGRRAAAGRSTQALPVLWNAPDFALTDHEGKAFHRAELDGTVWVASFIYTSCPDVCPLITAHMAELRDSLATEGLLGTSVRLVSFTVDPERDTPAVLRAYADKFGGADPERWAFLTGPPNVVRKMVTEGFHLGAMPVPADAAGGEGSGVAGDGGGGAAAAGSAGGRQGEHGEHGAMQAAGSYTVLHSGRLVLVDALGRVRGTYPATDPESLGRLGADLRAVLEAGAAAGET